MTTTTLQKCFADFARAFEGLKKTVSEEKKKAQWDCLVSIVHQLKADNIAVGQLHRDEANGLIQFKVSPEFKAASESTTAKLVADSVQNHASSSCPLTEGTLRRQYHRTLARLTTLVVAVGSLPENEFLVSQRNSLAKNRAIANVLDACSGPGSDGTVRITAVASYRSPFYDVKGIVNLFTSCDCISSLYMHHPSWLQANVARMQRWPLGAKPLPPRKGNQQTQTQTQAQAQGQAEEDATDEAAMDVDAEGEDSLSQTLAYLDLQGDATDQVDPLEEAEEGEDDEEMWEKNADRLYQRECERLERVAQSLHETVLQQNVGPPDGEGITDNDEGTCWLDRVLLPRLAIHGFDFSWWHNCVRWSYTTSSAEAEGEGEREPTMSEDGWRFFRSHWQDCAGGTGAQQSSRPCPDTLRALWLRSMHREASCPRGHLCVLACPSDVGDSDAAAEMFLAQGVPMVVCTLADLVSHDRNGEAVGVTPRSVCRLEISQSQWLQQGAALRQLMEAFITQPDTTIFTDEALIVIYGVPDASYDTDHHREWVTAVENSLAAMPQGTHADPRGSADSPFHTSREDQWRPLWRVLDKNVAGNSWVQEMKRPVGSTTHSLTLQAFRPQQYLRERIPAAPPSNLNFCANSPGGGDLSVTNVSAQLLASVVYAIWLQRRCLVTVLWLGLGHAQELPGFFAFLDAQALRPQVEVSALEIMFDSYDNGCRMLQQKPTFSGRVRYRQADATVPGAMAEGRGADLVYTTMVVGVLIMVPLLQAIAANGGQRFLSFQQNLHPNDLGALHPGHHTTYKYMAHIRGSMERRQMWQVDMYALNWVQLRENYLCEATGKVLDVFTALDQLLLKRAHGKEGQFLCVNENVLVSSLVRNTQLPLYTDNLMFDNYRGMADAECRWRRAVRSVRVIFGATLCDEVTLHMQSCVAMGQRYARRKERESWLEGWQSMLARDAQLERSHLQKQERERERQGQRENAIVL